jgi:hypothetical protein
LIFAEGDRRDGGLSSRQVAEHFGVSWRYRS